MSLKSSLIHLSSKLAWGVKAYKYLGALPRVLMYHGVTLGGQHTEMSAKSFEKQILWLKSYFEFVNPNKIDILSMRPNQILLTFDDGLMNNFSRVKPILEKQQVPAIFFVANAHCEKNNYLWFSYFRAFERFFKNSKIQFDSKEYNLNNSFKKESILELKNKVINSYQDISLMNKYLKEKLPPLEDFVGNEDLNEHFRGMSKEQVQELANNELFAIGGHTVDHPDLSYCSSEDKKSQILANKLWIEEVTGKKCKYFAYPLGEYDLESIKIVKEHFQYGFAVNPKHILDKNYELERFGIYRESIEDLKIKLLFGAKLRQMGKNIG